MRKLKAAFFACILAGIVSCGCDDCTYKEKNFQHTQIKVEKRLR